MELCPSPRARDTLSAHASSWFPYFLVSPWKPLGCMFHLRRRMRQNSRLCCFWIVRGKPLTCVAKRLAGGAAALSTRFPTHDGRIACAVIGGHGDNTHHPPRTSGQRDRSESKSGESTFGLLFSYLSPRHAYSPGCLAVECASVIMIEA